MSSSEFGLPTLQKLVESKNKIIAVYQKYKPFPSDSKPKIIEGIIEGLGK